MEPGSPAPVAPPGSPAPSPVSAASTWFSAEFDAERRPHFFKVFFPCYSSKRLAIPPAFGKHIEHETSGSICLTGPSGNEWNVDLVRNGDSGMAFQKGWEDFVLDHSLRTGDFLVFRYDGDGCFTVMVFDPTACEKEEALHAMPCDEVTILGESHPMRCANEDLVDDDLMVIDPRKDILFPPINTARRESPLSTSQIFPKENARAVEILSEERPRVEDGSLTTADASQECCSSGQEPAISTRDDSNKNHEDISMYESGSHCRMSPQCSMRKKPLICMKHPQWKLLSRSHSDFVSCVVKEEPKNDEGEIGVLPGPQMLKQKDITETTVDESMPNISICSWGGNFRRKSLQANRLLAVKQWAHKKKRNASAGNKAHLGIIQSRRRTITEDEKLKALEAAQLFHSKRPFCLQVMRDSYVYYGFFMYLPTPFVKHLPDSRGKMILWDSCDKPWKVVYIWNEGRGAFSGGWGKFARSHNLESDDVCVFEVLKPRELKVHIFRVVEEVVGGLAPLCCSG